MKRFTIILSAVLLLALLLGAASPTWPSSDLAYYKAADAQIGELRSYVEAGMTAFGAQDTDALAVAVEDIQAVADYFADEQAPAKLAPVASAGEYAGDVCAWVLDYYGKMGDDAATSPFTAPTLISMRTDCLDAIQSARLELARAVASVGAWPPAK